MYKLLKIAMLRIRYIIENSILNVYVFISFYILVIIKYIIRLVKHYVISYIVKKKF